jgi:hypothetical protein
MDLAPGPGSSAQVSGEHGTHVVESDGGGHQRPRIDQTVRVGPEGLVETR